ncbi:putative helicase mov-10-B.1 [Toxorhynchites rutilus septentrionalis]|uniref:putative helicase mov-10-B.1 n=1 Tax=Toxorhynchites rutilus septentrionalis TaxID=329112 RepID=UPI00247A1D9E|nr:putative helicase mov-10-B.1 [Toxorhynchites rutilus septentrionalis]
MILESNEFQRENTFEPPMENTGSGSGGRWKLQWKSTDLYGNRSGATASFAPESSIKPVFELELVEVIDEEPTFLLAVKNQSPGDVLLRSASLMKDNTKLLSILAGGEVTRMSPEHSRVKEFKLTHPYPSLEQIELFLSATAFLSGDSTIVHERYSFVRNTPTDEEGTEIDFNELPKFEIPKVITSLYENNFKHSATFGPEEIELLAKVEKAKELFVRSSETYKQQLTLLNQIEDEHLRQQFSDYSIDNPKLVDTCDAQKRIYTLSMNQFKQRPSIIGALTEVHIMVKNKDVISRGIIDRMDNETVFINMFSSISVDDVERIEFCANRTSFQLEYRALELLDETVVKKLFFPETIGANNVEQFTKISSNKEQMQAVKNIVNRTSFPAPYLLFGPPGTGKTSTLTEAICQILKLRPKSRVLVATASNFAANEIVNRLLEFIPSDDIFRFFSKSRESKMDGINGDLLGRSNYFRGSYEAPCYEDIYDTKVVVCTLATAGRLAQADISHHFDYIFIDECGCAKETSVLVAIAGIGASEKDINALVVLAGDPKQLGPVITYGFLKGTSQSTSMLERMMDQEIYRKDTSGRYNALVITQLRDNYRSHGALLNLSNDMFYDGQLRATASEEVANWALGWDRLPNPSFPMIFHPIISQIVKDLGSTSLYNQEEADQIIHYIEDLLSRGVNGKRVEQKDIGIISPYARQVNHLKSLCQKYGWNEIEIGSTEQYQGREKLIVLISTVRSQCPTVGFLADVRRLNVALTRARALLIVVGDPTTLERNKHWRKFLTYCRNNRAMLGYDSIPKNGNVFAVNQNMALDNPRSQISSQYAEQRSL